MDLGAFGGKVGGDVAGVNRERDDASLWETAALVEICGQMLFLIHLLRVQGLGFRVGGWGVWIFGSPMYTRTKAGVPIETRTPTHVSDGQWILCVNTRQTRTRNPATPNAKPEPETLRLTRTRNPAPDPDPKPCVMQTRLRPS